MRVFFFKFAVIIVTDLVIFTLHLLPEYVS